MATRPGRKGQAVGLGIGGEEAVSEESKPSDPKPIKFSGNANDYFLWLWNNRYAESEPLEERLRQFYFMGINWADGRKP